MSLLNMEKNISTISFLIWHYVSEYKIPFYRIEYILDGYYHKIQLGAFNVVEDVPQFICKALRAELDCDPQELVFR